MSNPNWPYGGVVMYGAPPEDLSPRVPTGLPIQVPTFTPISETGALQEALKTMGSLAADQRDQRIAAEAEARQMRGHVAALLRVIRVLGLPKRKLYRDLIAAAEKSLEPGGTDR